ncbi:hypothetical protein PHLGIDRAFT_299942 [Phlebiopsis gigantea 11061_1 CR5-6]|uniref:Uncharacterized protein n=1 Tax=Phlebiopsis gigantea (strain 11061_1 CR5-6) TaxID=745531 RepID=A0A0C3PBH1_PHLG1|nr:hypothetical protein PHLGIDRAFT_299942 [Phlebiopsis gigantea 11061_1 CR5-6]
MDEVRCYVTVVMQEGAIEGIFKDPDTYTLHIQTQLSPRLRVADRHRLSPLAAWDQFVGFQLDGELEAPNWTAWANDGVRRELHLCRNEAVYFFNMLAFNRLNIECNLTAPIINWVKAAAVGTEAEKRLRSEAQRLGF